MGCLRFVGDSDRTYGESDLRVEEGTSTWVMFRGTGPVERYSGLICTRGSQGHKVWDRSEATPVSVLSLWWFSGHRED